MKYSPKIGIPVLVIGTVVAVAVLGRKDGSCVAAILFMGVAMWSLFATELK